MADEPAAGAGERTGFLYPFIAAEERDAGPLLRDLGRSAVAKAQISADLRVATLDRLADHLERAARAMAAAFDAGARLFCFGNGGSSTDAAAIASLFARPPWGRALPARALVEDGAVLSALANDVGFDLVFSRQLIAHARAGDVTIGCSTSGSSRNVTTAFSQARSLGLLTVGLAGYQGGDMAASGDVEHCLVVASDSVHRIQETQAAVAFALWGAVQRRLQGSDG